MKKLIPALASIVCLVLITPARAQTYLNYSFTQPPQLSAAAGPDQLICPWDTAMIGGSPAALGGTSPYAYLWSPSTGLNSPVAANPLAAPGTSTIYTLLVTDVNNCSAMDTVQVRIDTCVGIGNSWQIERFDIYPNPNVGEFTVRIELKQKFQDIRLTITDLAGREVLNIKYPSASEMIEEQIRIERLSKGTYLIILEAEGLKVSRKMIVQ